MTETEEVKPKVKQKPKKKRWVVTHTRRITAPNGTLYGPNKEFCEYESKMKKLLEKDYVKLV